MRTTSPTACTSATSTTTPADTTRERRDRSCCPRPCASDGYTWRPRLAGLGASLEVCPAEAGHYMNTAGHYIYTHMLIHVPSVLTPEQVAHARQRLECAQW